MIKKMRDGNCRPSTTNWQKGRDVTGIVWNLPDGTSFRAIAPLLGWRIAPSHTPRKESKALGDSGPESPGKPGSDP